MEASSYKLNAILESHRSPDVRHVLDLHNSLYQELEGLQNSKCPHNSVEISDNKEFKHIMVRSLEKYAQNIERTCSQLKEEKSRSSPAISKDSSNPDIYEYIRNEMLADIFAQPIAWDHHFETKISQALNQRLRISANEEITAAGDGSYSCALGGKLLLSGRLKLCDGTYIGLLLRLCFESSFNKRNLFFGGTKLVVPKSHIIGVSASTMMLLPNSIEVQTRMGPLFFASLFYRDQLVKEFN